MVFRHKFTPTILTSTLSLLFVGYAQAATSLEKGSPQPQRQTRIIADHIDGQMEIDLKAEGNVYAERDDQTVNAEWVKYTQPDNTLFAGDYFKLTQGNQTVFGCSLNYNLSQRTGIANETDFDANDGKQRFRGTSENIEFQGRNLYLLNRAKVNTCDPGDDTWYLRSRTVRLDYNENVGTATNAWLQFYNIPIFYTPWIDFPLSNERKSGFLMPTVKSGSDGLQITVPYYFNLAPNYDLTLSPTYVADRGIMLGSEFRYLQPGYTGIISNEYLPGDKKTHRDRWLWKVNHQHLNFLVPKLSMNIDFSQASDDNYFRDFGDRLDIANNDNINREINFSYPLNFGKTNGFAYLRWQRYQTLQNENRSVGVPYARLPQFLFNLNRKWKSKLKVDLQSELTYFTHETQRNGVRATFYPSISWDYTKSWGFFRPKIGIHHTQYNLRTYRVKSMEDIEVDEEPLQVDGKTLQHEITTIYPKKRMTRTLPILSLDTGLTFERNSPISGDTQTLEPRLYYVYIPAKEQNHLPNFDTSENDFNYAQLFTENRYSGGDRINKANTLTAALTTRYIDNKTGMERVRAAIGQRYYFQRDDITLDGSLKPRAKRGSDLLATLGGDITRSLRLDTSYHWNQELRKTESFNAALVYNPKPGKTASLRYRYDRDAEIYSGYYGKIDQIDVAGQWPIARRWYVIGRHNYSFAEKKSLEQLAGFEYNDGCWILRVVGQRYASDINTTKNAVFIQLELKNLGGIGTDPFETLRQSIPGYSKINEITP